MHTFRVLFLLFIIINSCKGQTQQTEKNQIVGGPCQDCEAALDYQVLKIDPNPVDTLLGFQETEPKIKISGTLLKPDGKTPAGNVILAEEISNRIFSDHFRDCEVGVLSN